MPNSSPSHQILSVNAATSHDLDTIIALAQHVWPRVYQGILLPEHIDNMLMRIYSKNNLLKEMEDGHRYWIASLADTPVAFISGYHENSTVWLKKIYIDPDYQGRGLGRMLIKTLEDAFSPVTETRLLVNPDNHPAMDFYRHIGFTQIGTKPVKMGDYHFEDKIFSRPIKR